VFQLDAGRGVATGTNLTWRSVARGGAPEIIAVGEGAEWQRVDGGVTNAAVHGGATRGGGRGGGGPGGGPCHVVHGEVSA
jgi:hypothetical protein